MTVNTSEVDQATAFERYLLTRNREPRAEIDTMLGRPLPLAERGSGYEIWAALMEDLRANGIMRLAIATCEQIVVGYESVSGGHGA